MERQYPQPPKLVRTTAQRATEIDSRMKTIKVAHEFAAIIATALDLQGRAYIIATLY